MRQANLPGLAMVLAPGFLPSGEKPLPKSHAMAEIPVGERSHLEVLRTDTTTWATGIEARRNRRDGWNQIPAGHLELGNILVPVRRVGN